MSSEDPLTVYGYRITASDEEHSLSFIHDICSMNDIMLHSFQVYCMIRTIDNVSIDAVQLIIGFVPDNDLKKNIEYYEALKDFITDNPMFDGVNIAASAAFHTGFQWNDDMLDDATDVTEESLHSDDCNSSDTSDDCNSSENSDDCAASDDSDDVSSSENSDDYTSEEEDQSDEDRKHNDDKHLSYYVSKYYI